MPTYARKELEKASLGEGSNGVVGKTNNEKSKLVVGLWRTTQNYEVKLCHSREKELDWYEQGDKKLISPEG